MKTINKLKIMDSTSIKHIRGKDKKVIIFGAGVIGEVLYYACQEVGITIDYYVDNNTNLTKFKISGLEIIDARNLKDNVKNAVFIISSTYMKEIVDQLSEYGYSDFYDCVNLIRNLDSQKYQYNYPQHYVEFFIDACVMAQNGYLYPNKLTMRNVDIVVTEKCSMKCQDCSNLMQYYQTPKNYTFKELNQELNVLFSYVDLIYECRVIGGEPMMNKEFHLVVDKLINEKKVKKVVIYANGTIVPKSNQMNYLKNEKVLFIITDYDEQSKNITRLEDALSDNSINFYKQKADGWTDCGRIVKHERSFEEQKKLFRECCVHNFTTLANGKLYRCPFSANADSLNAVPNNKDDYIDIMNEKNPRQNIFQIKQKIKNFITDKDYLESCNYCNGRTYGSDEIQPAIQTKNPIEYIEFK